MTPSNEYRQFWHVILWIGCLLLALSLFCLLLSALDRRSKLPDRPYFSEITTNDDVKVVVIYKDSNDKYTIPVYPGYSLLNVEVHSSYMSAAYTRTK